MVRLTVKEAAAGDLGRLGFFSSMVTLRRFWLTLATLFFVSSLSSYSFGRDTSTFLTWAERPPMGWNSWDCFATTVTEAQTKAQADILAEKFARYGWEYVVVDIQWYEPAATGYDYRKGAPLVLDDYGRLLPAVNKFPSSEKGTGFASLAGYIHGKGLKFGLHLMRGIPRQAVEQNLPILGTKFHAADIADKVNVCPWNTDMYGVDLTKPGAQDYYNSVFALIASWGVDYVKVDDLSRPYGRNRPEVEAVRRAIDLTGRPIVLSLSPGETDIAFGAHVAEHANAWRISDDFWDQWPELLAQFERLHQWTPFRRLGAWPDADMIPFGVIEMGRKTRFTPAEHFTLMSLWCIARSPLMFGGDLTRLDDFTASFLSNDEALAVNRASANNRQLFRTPDGLIAWVADVPGTPDRYIGVFNTRDPLTLDPAKAAYLSPLVTGEPGRRAVDIQVEVSGAAKLVLVADDGGDGRAWDHAVWAEPTLVFDDGHTMKLTEMNWVRASAGHGEVSREKAPSGKPMKADGVPVSFGIAAHAPSLVEFDLPKGVKRFTARGVLDDAAVAEKKGGTLHFVVYAWPWAPEFSQPGVPVSIKLSDLGFSAPVRVRDLWEHKDLGEMQDNFAPMVEWHGGRLYRISPVGQ